MTNRALVLVALGGLLVLPACTSGQSAIEPPSKAAPIASTSKLQLAVGTANIAGTIGLNVVSTFRAPTGLTAVLVDTPSIAGPAGFLVPANAAAPKGDVDFGTNAITANPQTAAGTTVAVTTFGQSYGALAYGISPNNITQSGAAVFGGPSLPFFAAAADQLPYIIGNGNSFVPNFRDGTQPAGFPGYAVGFDTFLAPPVAGTYTLTVAVGTANTAAIPNFVATANLTNPTPLGTFAAPTFTSDGTGGGTIGIVVPAGVTETLVFVVDSVTGNAYTLEATAAGAQTLTLPDAIGPIVKGVAGPTLTPGTAVGMGDAVAVYAVGFDYPAIEASPIGANVPQAPRITGANGQADVTTSAATAGAE